MANKTTGGVGTNQHQIKPRTSSDQQSGRARSGSLLHDRALRVDDGEEMIVSATGRSFAVTSETSTGFGDELGDDGVGDEYAYSVTWINAAGNFERVTNRWGVRKIVGPNETVKDFVTAEMQETIVFTDLDDPGGSEVSRDYEYDMSSDAGESMRFWHPDADLEYLEEQAAQKAARNAAGSLRVDRELIAQGEWG